MKSLTKWDSCASGGSGTPEIFARGPELDTLRQRLAKRQSFLLHGPAGAGKTLLLSTVCPEFSLVLYSPRNAAPQELYRNLAMALLAAEDSAMTRMFPDGVAQMQKKSATAMKGIVRDVLQDSQYVLVLDHLLRPSQSLAGCVRELKVNCSVPVVAVARSNHMEDAGFVAPLFADRRENLALRNFDRETATQFALCCAAREELAAVNREAFLEKIAEYSEGNPGAMLEMIRMAKAAKYVRDGNIKISPLYIDYKLATVSR